MLRYRTLSLFLLIALLPMPVLAQEQTATDSTRLVRMTPIVVTATRTAKELADVAVPMSVVPAEQITAQGAVRLSDVLEELTGLALFDDHGTGIQVQGFDPDYTLILIDGEPVIGRTAGTLALDRLTVAGIERVEVVRGPSSSLYGSEALAGVINLITRPPADGLAGSLRARYGTHQTTDLTATADAGTERFGVRALVNRYGSGGYDLTPATFGPTTPQFTDHTVDVRLRLEPTDHVALHLGGRLGLSEQESVFALQEAGQEVSYDQHEHRADWSLHPEVHLRLSPRLRLEASLYAARYLTETRMERQPDGAPYYLDDFDQRYGKAELQANLFWNARHLTVFGIGGVTEMLAGDRYTERPEARSGFAFVQHEWIPSRLLELNVSARFDAHSDFAARLSPKVAVLVRPIERLRLRASVGSGFKAPDFRQLYLNFTNAAAGYSVLGSTQVQTGLQRMQADGRITELFVDPASLATIQAESSVAYNVGFSAEPFGGLAVSLNAFRNNVRDLIDTQPIAQKANGAFVYGYFNLARIYTQGIQTEVTVGPWRGVSLTAGYQFLQAHDRAVVDALRAGTVFGRRPNGRDYRLTLADYSGLFGRSKHSGVARATYRMPERDLTLTLRGVWRGRYGYRDLDGNGFANRTDEFVSGYAVWNTTLTKSWALPPLDRLTLQFGIDNLLDVTRPSEVPSLPGRTLYAGLQLYL